MQKAAAFEWSNKLLRWTMKGVCWYIIEQSDDESEYEMKLKFLEFVEYDVSIHRSGGNHEMESAAYWALIAEGYRGNMIN